MGNGWYDGQQPRAVQGRRPKYFYCRPWGRNVWNRKDVRLKECKKFSWKAKKKLEKNKMMIKEIRWCKICIRITQLSVVVLCLPLGRLAPPVAILRYWGYYVASDTPPTTEWPPYNETIIYPMGFCPGDGWVINKIIQYTGLGGEI